MDKKGVELTSEIRRKPERLRSCHNIMIQDGLGWDVKLSLLDLHFPSMGLLVALVSGFPWPLGWLPLSLLD